jgi:hypothetical protein
MGLLSFHSSYKNIICCSYKTRFALSPFPIHSQAYALVHAIPLQCMSALSTVRPWFQEWTAYRCCRLRVGCRPDFQTQ